MDQQTLFHESISDALGAAILAAGGRKRVAAALWPTLKPDIGYARVSACLSHDKPEKFSPDEVLHIARIARMAGDHAVMQYLANELGYRVEPVSQRDQLTDALERFDHTADQLLTAIAAVKRAQIKAAS